MSKPNPFSKAVKDQLDKEQADLKAQLHASTFAMSVPKFTVPIPTKSIYASVKITKEDIEASVGPAATLNAAGSFWSTALQAQTQSNSNLGLLGSSFSMAGYMAYLHRLYATPHPATPLAISATRRGRGVEFTILDTVANQAALEGVLPK